MTKQSKQKIRKKQKWYDTDWFRGLELAAIVIGIIGVSVDVVMRFTVDREIAWETKEEFKRSAIQFNQTQEQLRQARIEQAYTIFRDKNDTRTRRLQAAETLLQHDTLGLKNFSCSQFSSDCSDVKPRYSWIERYGEVRDGRDGDLNSFDSLNLSGVELNEWNLNEIAFNYVSLVNSEFDINNWKKVTVRCSDLSKSKIWARDNFDVRFLETDISKAEITIDFELKSSTQPLLGTYFVRTSPPTFIDRSGPIDADISSKIKRAIELGAELQEVVKSQAISRC